MIWCVVIVFVISLFFLLLFSLVWFFGVFFFSVDFCGLSAHRSKSFGSSVGRNIFVLESGEWDSVCLLLLVCVGASID